MCISHLALIIFALLGILSVSLVPLFSLYVVAFPSHSSFLLTQSHSRCFHPHDELYFNFLAHLFFSPALHHYRPASVCVSVCEWWVCGIYLTAASHTTNVSLQQKNAQILKCWCWFDYISGVYFCCFALRFVLSLNRHRSLCDVFFFTCSAICGFFLCKVVYLFCSANHTEGISYINPSTGQISHPASSSPLSPPLLCERSRDTTMASCQPRIRSKKIMETFDC